MKIVTLVDVERFSLGQRDQLESYTRELPVTLLGDGRVLIGSEEDGMAFDLGDLQRAVEVLER